MKDRLNALMPGGIPRWVRCYDNGGASFDRYTVLYIKRPYYQLKQRGIKSWGYRGMSEYPRHPQGFGIWGESDDILDLNRWGYAPAMGRKCHLGTRVPFESLPEQVREVVIQDYMDIWELQPINISK